MTNWSGVFPAMTTQFRADGSLDLDATAEHCNVIIESGVAGLVMLGSLGENLALEPEEKEAVLKCAIDTSDDRVPVLTGIAENTPTAARRWLDRAAEMGAGGAMLLPAMVYRADAREALAHFRTVAKNSPLPLIAYNNPLGYGVDVTPEMFQDLADLDQIVAIKESSGDVRRITDLFNTVGDRYAIFAGVDDLALECVMLGATGWIAGIGLAFPMENQRLWDLAMAGKWEEARALYRWYTPLLHLDVGNKFVQNIKLCIQEVGLGKENVRMPRMPLVGEERDRVMKIIHHGLETRPA